MQETQSKMLLTVPEAAARLSLGRATVYTLIQKGRLKPVKIGRAVRLPVDELQRFVRELQQTAEEHLDA